MKKGLHIEKMITHRKIIGIVGKNMWVQRKELHLKIDIHERDIKTERKITNLPKENSYEITYKVYNIYNHKENNA